ncbi:MAG: zinc ribbon domain-containing protein [Burkholderiaceae bacterium]|jgi:putative FmdB family regulatory protein|nr:zinc ribbon domain-containing protein [Burkholderiaceae bacterium]
MPIYAYKCASCGYAKDVLQKISDAPLAVCPQCGQAAFHKQVTAAGFQLKGSGWYATDFRGGASAPGAPADKDGKAEAKPDAKPDVKGEAAASKPASGSQSQSSGAAAATAPAAPAPGGAASGA